MRICIINEYFYPDNAGGTGTVLSDLALRLRADFASDVAIDVVTSRNLYRSSSDGGDGAFLPAHEDWDGIRITRLATPKPNGLPTPLRLVANLLFSIAALKHLLSASAARPDLLLVGTAPPMVAFAAHAYRRLRGVPFVYVVYDLEPDRSVTMKLVSADHPFARAFRKNQKRWLHAASKIIVLGRCMRDHVEQTYALRPRQIEVIPIGADPQEVAPLPKESRFRQKHGLSGFIVCYAGNFGRYHDFDTLLEAAKELETVAPNVNFLLVGSGAQKERIVQRIARERLQNVRLFPFVDKQDYPDLLASADVSLVTLEPGMEGICVPSKFYSIMASGRPTIAMMGPQSEVALVIGEEDCGVQIRPGDTSALVKTLADLARRPERVEEMGRNARSCLVDRYTTKQGARRYHQVFRAALAQREVEEEEEAGRPVPKPKMPG